MNDKYSDRMDEKLNKLEFMLVGLRQMNLGSVCTYFVGQKREDIIAAIKNSPKFKIEGDIVSLKSDSERYEEELQRDILKDLIGEDTSSDDAFLDDMSDFDDDLELQENIVEATPIVDVSEPIIATEIEEVEEISEIEPSGIEVSEWEDVVIEPVEAKSVEVKPAVKSVPKVVKDEPKKTVAKKSEFSIDEVNGADLSYETILRLLDEYNNSVESQLNYSVANRYEVREKAIRTFYENKYNVKLKEKSIFDTKTNIFALINRKRGMEAAYLLVCETLTDTVLNYMLDHYDDEVVYFCPIDAVQVEFEVGLNEFYLKDTDIIFDRYLEHYEIVEEAEKSVKKLEIIVGNH